MNLLFLKKIFFQEIFHFCFMASGIFDLFFKRIPTLLVITLFFITHTLYALEVKFILFSIGAYFLSQKRFPASVGLGDFLFALITYTYAKNMQLNTFDVFLLAFLMATIINFYFKRRTVPMVFYFVISTYIIKYTPYA